MDEPQSILVRAPNWLGDAVMALPVFAALRERFPRARIAAACRANLTDIFAAAPDVDETVPVPRGTVALLHHALSLRPRRFDLGILLTNSFATAAWLRLAGARARIGYARDGRALLLTRAVKTTPEILAAHQAKYYFALLRECGIERPLPRPRLTLTTKAEAEAEAYRQAQGLTPGRYAVIAPCSAFGPVKDWAPERYAETARALAAGGLDVAVTGTPAQRETIAKICGDGGRPGGRVLNAGGAVSLQGLFALIRQAAVFVGGDSGSAHAAAAVDTPAVVIFGITEPSRTRPLGDDAQIRIIGKGGLETPDLHSPEVAAAARAALESIAAEEVIAAAQAVMRKN